MAQLLNKDNSVSFHTKNLRFHAIEMLQQCKLLLEKIYTCQREIHKATLLKFKKKKKKERKNERNYLVTYTEISQA